MKNINNLFFNNCIVLFPCKSKFRLKRMPTTSKTSWKIDKKYEFFRQILNLNDSELNELCYKEALKNDHRSFGSFYLSLIKLKHLLIFSFFPINDYNSQVVKIDLFFINFTIYFTVNTLFFSDKTMHKIYIDNGDYNIIYQLPQILYSSLISGVINALFFNNSTMHKIYIDNGSFKINYQIV